MADTDSSLFACFETRWEGGRFGSGGLAGVEEALRGGGLDWTARQEPLTLANHPGRILPMRVALVRSDLGPEDRRHVLGIVGPKFVPLQNRDAAMIVDGLLGAGGRRFSTAGYLRDGKFVWLQAKLPVGISVGGTDRLETFLTFSNSHDGSRVIDFRLTTVRIVCRNTLSLALKSGASEHILRLRHSKSSATVRTMVHDFYDWIALQCRQIEVNMNRMAATDIDEEAFRQFLEKLIPEPAAPADSASDDAKARFEQRRDKVIGDRAAIDRVFGQGLPAHGDVHPEIEPAPHTVWGALNAVTAWVDHGRDNEENWYADIMFGEGDRLKREAHEIATTLTEEG